MSGVSADDGRRRAWGWVAHLRAGGTSSWQDWRAHADGSADASSRRALPGAQQLELLRRLNLAGRPSADLVERVIGASAAGRGSPDLELVGAAADTPFGPRPVEPSGLPTRELLRVATALLAEELAGVGLPDRPASARMAWRRDPRVVGDPWVVSALPRPARRAVVGRPSVLVAGGPLALLLADVWSARCFEGGAPQWGPWLAGLEQRRRVPPRVDLPRMADTWSRRVGAAQVTVDVRLADGRRDGALDGAPGGRPGEHAAPGAAVKTARPSGDAAELARRVAPVLGLLVPPARRARLLGEVLRPRLVALPGGGAAGVRPGVPDERADWVARRARRMAETLRRGDYAVAGDPREVLPATVPGAAPTGAGALDLALLALSRGGPDTAPGAAPGATGKADR